MMHLPVVSESDDASTFTTHSEFTSETGTMSEEEISNKKEAPLSVAMEQQQPPMASISFHDALDVMDSMNDDLVVGVQVPSVVLNDDMTTRVEDDDDLPWDMDSSFSKNINNEMDTTSSTWNTFWKLWRGPILVYTVCFILPTLSDLFMNKETLQYVQEMWHNTRDAALRFMDGHVWCGTMCMAWKERIRKEWMEPAMEYVCHLEDCDLEDWDGGWNNTLWKTYTSVAFWAHRWQLFHRWNLCPVEMEEPMIMYRPVMAPDIATEWKRDLALVTALSTALTTVRLVVTFVATKLSYYRGATNTTRKQEQSRETNDASSEILPIDSFKSVPELVEENEPRETAHALQSKVGHSDAFKANEEPMKSNLSSDSFKSLPEEKNTSPSSTTTMKVSSNTSISPEASLPGSAFFRSLYCTAVAVIAWRWFHDAEFWPNFVLGQGTLDRCWDLIIDMDDDPEDQAYQEQNTLLRYYTLIQASYYVHSVTFRFVRFLVRRKRRTSLLLSLVQSALALGLLALAYSFSSLRRLMAIGMFALDVSSAIRHFWQLCVPAATVTTTGVVRWALTQVLYWTLVLPSYMATRFYVYPMLWYSATNATEWRIRLEELLWKGSEEQFLRLCHVCMVLSLLVSVFSLKTLIEMRPLQRQKRSIVVISPDDGHAG